VTEATARAVLDLHVSERDFQKAITDACEALRLPWFHVLDARGQQMTSWPDLVIVQPPILRLWELKTQRGTASDGQAALLALLRQCDRLDVECYRPSNWPTIERALMEPNR
jgi:hypothetical protein